MLVHGRGRVGGARSLPRTPADTRGCSLLSCLQSTRELPGSPLALRLESQSSRDPDRAWGPRGSPAAAVGGFPGRPGADLNVPVHLPRVLSHRDTLIICIWRVHNGYMPTSARAPPVQTRAPARNGRAHALPPHRHKKLRTYACARQNRDARMPKQQLKWPRHRRGRFVIASKIDAVPQHGKLPRRMCLKAPPGDQRHAKLHWVRRCPPRGEAPSL